MLGLQVRQHPILHTKNVVLCPSSVTLRLLPPDSEAGWAVEPKKTKKSKENYKRKNNKTKKKERRKNHEAKNHYHFKW